MGKECIRESEAGQKVDRSLGVAVYERKSLEVLKGSQYLRKGGLGGT